MRPEFNMNFLPRFVEPVLAGQKSQTIRHARKFPPRPGETMVFKCNDKPFGKAMISDVLPIRFYAAKISMIYMHGKVLSAQSEEELAGRDGLTAAELKKFLGYYSRNKNGWNDYIAIRWKDFVPANGKAGIKKRADKLARP
jgi:hypothetical protein